MAKKSRDKGASFEREIANHLTARYKVLVKRRLGQARDSGHDLDAGPLVIECKRRKSLKTLTEWYAQVVRAAREPRGAAFPPQRIPVVVMREDGGIPLALVSLEDLADLVLDIREPTDV